jgi:glycerate-2-kinase
MSSKLLLETTFHTLLDELNPKNLIKEAVSVSNDVLTVHNQSYSLPNKVTLLGSGKAVLPMAESLVDILGDKIDATLCVGAYENTTDLEIEYIQSTHPLPSQNSLKGANALINKLETLDEDDFFIYLLSGGNSSLVELPVEPITLQEFQNTTDKMLKSGMPIEKINCVRKHLSQVKGGKLRNFTKANGIVLVLSDVLEDNLMAIGSAPLYFDDTTYDEAIEYLKEYSIWNNLDTNVKDVLVKQEYETPKKESKNIKHFILGSNETVIKKAQSLLESKNTPTFISKKKINDNVNNIVNFLEQEIIKNQEKQICLLFGGEATVEVKGDGKGGRNQHLTLLMCEVLNKYENITFLSAATDGIDGNSDAAGALIDSNSFQNAKTLGVDIEIYKNNFDSNSYFKTTNELVISGSTHNNLLDIVMILINQKGE